MALTKCPDCGREVSTAATICPQCGRPLGIITKTQGEGLFMQSLNAGCGVVIAIIIVGLIILIFNMP